MDKPKLKLVDTVVRRDIQEILEKANLFTELGYIIKLDYKQVQVKIGASKHQIWVVENILEVYKYSN